MINCNPDKNQKAGASAVQQNTKMYWFPSKPINKIFLSQKSKIKQNSSLHDKSLINQNLRQIKLQRPQKDRNTQAYQYLKSLSKFQEKKTNHNSSSQGSSIIESEYKQGPVSEFNNQMYEKFKKNLAQKILEKVNNQQNKTEIEYLNIDSTLPKIKKWHFENCLHLVYSNRYKNIQCAICLNNIKNGQIISVLYCEHYFHRNCVEQWLQSSNNCALCRIDFTSHEIYMDDQYWEPPKSFLNWKSD